MRLRSEEFAADAGLVLVAAIWGINFSVLKLVLVELDPLVLNALRFPLAAVALGAVVVARGAPHRPRREDLPGIIALGLVGNVVYQLCFIYGLDWTQAGNASLILATTPVWTVLMSAALGHERLSGRVLGGVVTTLLGMVFVVLGRGDAVGLTLATLRGDLMMIVAAVLWSVYTVAARAPLARYGALSVTTWTLWVGTPVLVAVGLPGLGALAPGTVSPGAWAGVVYAGLMSVGVAYLLWYGGVKKLGNNRTAVYSNLVPVWALLSAWLWLREVPTAIQLGGAAIILMGLMVARSGRAATPESPVAEPTPVPPAPALRPDR